MRLLWTLLTGWPLLIAFKVAPRWVALHALHGCLSAFGYSKAAFPLSVVRDLADDSLRMSFVHKEGRGLVADAAALYRSVNLTAIQVHALMNPDAADRHMLTTTAHTQSVLTKHGVRVRNESIDWRDL